MTMKQRVFSMLLCVALLFSVFPQVAFAQGDVLDSGLAANALARTGGKPTWIGTQTRKSWCQCPSRRGSLRF